MSQQWQTIYPICLKNENQGIIDEKKKLYGKRNANYEKNPQKKNRSKMHDFLLEKPNYVVTMLTSVMKCIKNNDDKLVVPIQNKQKYKGLNDKEQGLVKPNTKN